MRQVDQFANDLFSRFGENLERASFADLDQVAEREVERLGGKFDLPEPPPETGDEAMDGETRNLHLNELLASLLRAMDSVPPDEIMILMFACLATAVLPEDEDGVTT